MSRRFFYLSIDGLWTEHTSDDVIKGRFLEVLSELQGTTVYIRWADDRFRARQFAAERKDEHQVSNNFGQAQIPSPFSTSTVRRPV